MNFVLLTWIKGAVRRVPTPRSLLVAAFLTLSLSLQGQTVVYSIADLIPYLDDDNVDIQLAPGVYSIGPSDVTSGLLPNPDILVFSGNNSTFDFTGVTLEVDTNIFRSYGNINVTEIAVTGTNLVLKNLTLVDVGEVVPRRTALGVLLDGISNRVEGFHMTIRGSYPYGYGDLFGKGSGYVIKHFKHSGVLIRGNSNHLKDTTLIHRAYGHGIFCQGSIDALIEGCYVEGEMRSTDDVLAEAGTGSPADSVNFMTVWGYPVPPGAMFSLQEDGIRAYNTGPDPSGVTRNTANMQVIDCTVKNMRSGVTIGFCDNQKYVENVTSIGCENGFWVGTGGQIVASRGDAKYGPLLANAYQNDRDSVVDLEVLDTGPTYGNTAVAYIGGNGHDITLRNRDANPDQSLQVMVCGLRPGMRFVTVNPTYNDFSSDNVVINNLTEYPLVLASKSSNTTGQSAGTITDSGTGNAVSATTIASLPAPWSGEDVGNVAAAGTASYSNGTFTIEGSGADIWGTSDEFQFLSQWVTASEATITARVDSGENTNSWAKAGVMIRETMESGSRNAALVVTPSKGVSFQWRDEKDGSSGYSAASGLSAPYWVRLQRSGGTISAYRSSDGNTWTSAGSVNIDMNSVIAMGLCVTSHNDGTLCTGEFSNVQVEGGELEGYWTFDSIVAEEVADSSGSVHNASLWDGTIVAGVNGGNAIQFDGVDDAVWLNATAFEDIDQEVSVAMWVYGDASQPKNDSVFYAVDASGNRFLNIHLPWSNSTVYWDAGYSGGSYDRIQKTATLSEFAGQWNHWVFTKNATTGDMKIYLNGSLWHSGSGKTKGMSEIVTGRIGSGLNNNFYSGTLDEVMLYSVELSAAEVLALYNSF
ncbi:LamG-like jellyroll fold domain-containing protein [Pelagicoccus sp. SDUM812005]|uniref:LamG-like jellyroll fold domain-containing protein n=1 Tax=Pelagicoccus sp. SDUM812005 TaxID=3041257 RepID=UPI00280FCCB3|nr:LamG-like jellyroll fold domain-containing protein [Pelagicoccus sp. SDUM812005]MDQ8179590.1 hypothetical protein [Pelagicoccus sp. SDUM812005]